MVATCERQGADACEIVLVGFVMALADKSEFRGLGLFFLHLFVITPFFLVAPALLRIPSDQATKPYVVFLQYLIYGLLALSWPASVPGRIGRVE